VTATFAINTAPEVAARIEAWLKHRESVRDNRARLGLVGYAYLAAMLVQKPATTVGLMQRASMGHVAAYRFLGTLQALRYAHVAGWELEPRRTAKPLLAFGPGDDAPPPALRPNGRPVEAVRLPARQLCPSVLHFVQLLRCIETPACIPELMDSTGLHRDQITDCLETLVQLQLAHVPLWARRRHRGARVKFFKLGPGRNVAPPSTSRHAPRVQRQRRRRSNGFIHDVTQHLAAAGHVSACGGAA